MVRVMKLCALYGVGIGAHPSYPDRENFGRKDMNLSTSEISESVYPQVGRLIELAGGLGLEVRHVKAHGALYNNAAKDQVTALAIARGVAGSEKSSRSSGWRTPPPWTSGGMRALSRSARPSPTDVTSRTAPFVHDGSMMP